MNLKFGAPTPDVFLKIPEFIPKDLGYAFECRYLALVPDARGAGMAIDDGLDEYNIPPDLWKRWRYHVTVEQVVQNLGEHHVPEYVAVVLDTRLLLAFVMGEHEANLLCAKQHSTSVNHCSELK